MRKCFYYKDWVGKGICSIMHLLDSNGNLLTYDNFIGKYNLVCTNKQYSAVIKAIPHAMIILIQGMLIYSVVIPAMPLLSYRWMYSNCKAIINI